MKSVMMMDGDHSKTNACMSSNEQGKSGQGSRERIGLREAVSLDFVVAPPHLRWGKRPV